MPLTAEESARIPWAQATSQHVLTFEDRSQELAVDFTRIHLSTRFPRVERLWLSRILDPHVAIPVMMGTHKRLGANSELHALEPAILHSILELTR